MIAIDTGILALALNRWGPDHARVAHRLEAIVHGETPWAVTWPALHELIVRTTHRHWVARPLSPVDAAAFVERLLASPVIHALGPTPRHGAVLREVVAALGDGDAPVGLDSAVILREHGVRELWTRDPAMRRYGFLTAVDPLQADGARTEGPMRRRYRNLRMRAAR